MSAPITVAELIKLLVADMFCGAGGFDAGLKLALKRLAQRIGGEIFDPELLAINHWQVAIDSHELNHPEARRICDDVFATDPLKAIPGGKLDLLLASPTCTYFSRARGSKPISWDQRKGRMTPQQVERWCRELEPSVVILENVPEFVFWGPVCQVRDGPCAKHGWEGPTPGKRAICGKPHPGKRGAHFRRFLRTLEGMGYAVVWKILNAANYGDMTTRERFFLIARRDGVKIVFPEQTHSENGESSDRPGVKLPRWRGARKAIDWKIRGKSIFKRKKPLAAKTLVRILAGLKKFLWPERFIRKLVLYMRNLGIPIPEDAPSPVRKVGAGQFGLFGDPALVVLRQHADCRSVDRPLPAVAAAGTHLGVVSPEFVFPVNQGGDRKRGYLSVEKPLSTVTASGHDFGLVAGAPPPMLVPQSSESPAASVENPLGTVTTTSRGIRLIEAGESFVIRSGMHKSNSSCTRGAHEPLATVTTDGGMAVIAPEFVQSQGAGGAPRSVEAPLPSTPTRGATAIVTAYYGNGGSKSVESPLDTVTTRDRFGMVVPVTHDDASMRARDASSPLPTVTGANRGELAVVTPFMPAAFGDRPGQAPRVRSVDEPATTIPATGRINLIDGATAEPLGRLLEWPAPGPLAPEILDEWVSLKDVDILFRMLQPHELARAMGFPRKYKFVGNKSQKTRQIGNAVAVNTAAALVASVLETWVGVGVPQRRRRRVA